MPSSQAKITKAMASSQAKGTIVQPHGSKLANWHVYKGKL